MIYFLFYLIVSSNEYKLLGFSSRSIYIGMTIHIRLLIQKYEDIAGACCLGGNTILTVQTGVLRRHDPPSHQLLSVKYDDNVNGVHGIGCS